jgi:hypothetical protein
MLSAGAEKAEGTPWWRRGEGGNISQGVNVPVAAGEVRNTHNRLTVSDTLLGQVSHMGI